MTVLYPKGVRWHCKRCAMCCANTQDHVRVIRLMRCETERISRATRKKEDQFSKRANDSQLYVRTMRKRNGKCFFLKDNLCLVYNDRPITCVFYPFFLTHVSQDRMKICLTPEDCPGLGVGEVIDRSDYLRLVKMAFQKILTKMAHGVPSFLD